MKQFKTYIYILSIILLVPNLFADEKEEAETDLIGTVWQLVKNGSFIWNWAGCIFSSK